MLPWLLETLRKFPEIAVMLTLLLGFAVGKLRIKGFTLGTVTGVLLVGILIGSWHIDIPGETKSIFFLFFLFCTGYGIGPQFFAGLKKDGLPIALFSFIVCCSSLLMCWGISSLLHLETGTTAGLMSGANTCSAIIGVASNTINELKLSDDEKNTLINQIPVAYAVTYIFGTAGTSWFLSVVGPWFMSGSREKLIAETRELEAKVTDPAAEGEENITNAYDHVAFRAYLVSTELTGSNGRSVGEIEQIFHEKKRGLYILRVRNEGKVKEADRDYIVKPGDIIAVGGQRSAAIATESLLGKEVADAELLNFPVQTVSVIISNKAAWNKPLRSFMKHPEFHGISMRKLTRSGIEMPINGGTVLRKGDVVELVGIQEELQKAVNVLGYKESGGMETDIIYLSLGIVIGTLVGSLSVSIGNVPVELSTSGGALIAGLFFGWLRGAYPRFGYIPPASQWVLTKLGLHIFIAIVGLTASEGFLQGLKTEGLTLFLAGVVLSLSPMVLALFLSKYVFKFHPAIGLGACAGAHDESAPLLAVQDAINSKVPALGYTVAYAVANITLTTSGVIIVLLMHHG
ncbi:putative transport protein [Chitinophaga terrae (ex Kim and Jung 2007)]|uniref:aspartate-alanine antiporter n=1 Tax=Chitinophaga terrae (ex Kim and Jung 2007) TaxID=408074 RepID=UPI00277FCA33|nr:aspartate-alanine antiporter [Chitinophaga terrae (ex Kim and Jung 2007)]MDQ0109454.1 putative transport protein [Chitinophaga terrae (ex Kim and Jung 2007)]